MKKTINLTLLICVCLASCAGAKAWEQEPKAIYNADGSEYTRDSALTDVYAKVVKDETVEYFYENRFTFNLDKSGETPMEAGENWNSFSLNFYKLTPSYKGTDLDIKGYKLELAHEVFMYRIPLFFKQNELPEDADRMLKMNYRLYGVETAKTNTTVFINRFLSYYTDRHSDEINEMLLIHADYFWTQIAPHYPADYIELQVRKLRDRFFTDIPEEKSAEYDAYIEKLVNTFVGE